MSRYGKFAADADGHSRSQKSALMRSCFSRHSRTAARTAQYPVLGSGRRRPVACNWPVLPGTVSRVETSLSHRKQKMATRSTRNVPAHEFDGNSVRLSLARSSNSDLNARNTRWLRETLFQGRSGDEREAAGLAVEAADVDFVEQDRGRDDAAGDSCIAACRAEGA